MRMTQDSVEYRSADPNAPQAQQAPQAQHVAKESRA